MTWQQRAVESLRLSKDEGRSWRQARVLAAAAVKIPAKDSAASSLFDQQHTGEAFFWRVAENAYLDVKGPPGSGNGPALRFFSGLPEDVPMTRAEIERAAHPRKKAVA